MANIITKPVAFTKNVWKGGIASGAKAGISQGLFGALGFHPFFSRLFGGVVATAMVKNTIDKRIILVESTKESLYQLLAGE